VETERLPAPNPAELVRLAAIDSVFFSHTFFPRTVRARTPEFHRDIWEGLDNPLYRYFAAKVFRDGAKTSLLRLYAAKRISYFLSRTILFVGKGEDHAARSVEWLLNQVEGNRLWRNTFGLRPGRKWTRTEAEILHLVESEARGEEVGTRVLAVGMSGQIRGINIEDHRSDLIIVDDPCDQENTATPDARQKTAEQFFGAIYQSLVSSEEAMLAKLVLLQTPLNAEDLISTVIKDPMWHGVSYGCFDEEGKSRWEERKPTKDLLREKEGFAARRQLSIWYREMECKIIAPEEAAFDATWLRHFSTAPEGGVVVLSIDPVPPPSELEIRKGLRGKDSEVLAAVKRVGDDYYVLDYRVNKGHTPEWTTSEFFSLALSTTPRPMRVVVEAIAYQRTLAWILRRAMAAQRQFFPVEEVVDKRKKFDRIVDTLSGIASAGHLHVRPDQHELLDQFRSYPDVTHDDILDAVAMAVMKLMTMPSLAVAYGGAEPGSLPPPPPRDYPEGESHQRALPV
jgi:hypothetical protein